jgi:hypothetical protein
MEKDWTEFALWGFVGIIFSKLHVQSIYSSFPKRAYFAWNFAFPTE